MATHAIALIVLPLSFVDVPRKVDHLAEAVPQEFSVLAEIQVSGWIDDLAKRAADAILELSFKDKACLVNELRVAFHLIVFETSDIELPIVILMPYETIGKAHDPPNPLIGLPFTFEQGAVVPSERALSVPLAAFELSVVLAPLESAIDALNAEVVLELSLLAGAAIVEVTLVLIVVHELDLAHIVQATVPDGPCFANAVIRYC